MPVFTCPRLHDEGFGGFFHQSSAADFDFQHHRLDVARQHNVAATPEDEFGQTAKCGVSDHLAQRLHVGNTHQCVRLGHNVECVVRL